MREHGLSVAVAPGLTVKAILRTPNEAPQPCPVVVHCPGWMSTKDATHYRSYHEYLADHDIAGLVFDYRYTVVAEDPHILDPVDLVSDAVAVVGRLGASDLPIDVGRIVLFGSGGIGAGIAIVAAASIPAIAAVVALSPIASGERWLRWMRRPYEYRDLLAEVARDRDARRRGESPATIVPIGGISLPPPERERSRFKHEIRGRLPELVALESVQRILDFDVTTAAANLDGRTLQLIACRDDVAVPYEDAELLQEAAGASARLVTLEGTSSYDMHRTRSAEIAQHLVDVVGETGETAWSNDDTNDATTEVDP